MDVRLIELAPTHVAFMRHTGAYGTGVSRFWRERFLPWRTVAGLDHAVCYGIGHDDPAVTPDAACRYDACVAVPEGFEPAPGVAITHLAGGLHAVATFRGTPELAAAAWAELLQGWLPASGWRRDGRPCFERYDAQALAVDHGMLACELCVPVERR